MPRDSLVGVWVEKSLKERLVREARARETPVSELVRPVLTGFVDALEREGRA